MKAPGYSSEKASPLGLYRHVFISFMTFWPCRTSSAQLQFIVMGCILWSYIIHVCMYELQLQCHSALYILMLEVVSCEHHMQWLVLPQQEHSCHPLQQWIVHGNDTCSGCIPWLYGQRGDQIWLKQLWCFCSARECFLLFCSRWNNHISKIFSMDIICSGAQHAAFWIIYMNNPIKVMTNQVPCSCSWTILYFVNILTCIQHRLHQASKFYLACLCKVTQHKWMVWL